MDLRSSKKKIYSMKFYNCEEKKETCGRNELQSPTIGNG